MSSPLATSRLPTVRKSRNECNIEAPRGRERKRQISLDIAEIEKGPRSGSPAGSGRHEQRQGRMLSVACPFSPTDALASPCSRALSAYASGRHRRASPATSEAKKIAVEMAQENAKEHALADRGKVDVELRIKPRPAPCSVPFVLGSSSPYRRFIMTQLGWKFTTASPDIDEKAIRDPDPRTMCAAIAHAKAQALAASLHKSTILVTADQVCVFDGDKGEEIREKPTNADEARAFLESYSNRSVRTLSAVCVINLRTGRVEEGVHECTVIWRAISPEVVDAVVARGLTLGSAGGFALEDPDLQPLVARIDGSVDSVLGLPVDMLCELIEKVVS